MGSWRAYLLVFPFFIAVAALILWAGVALVFRLLGIDTSIVTLMMASVAATLIVLHVINMLNALAFMRKLNTELLVPLEIAWMAYEFRSDLEAKAPYEQWNKYWVRREVYELMNQKYDT